MVRLWTWEAFAHGAEVVSYFRWRQAPFAQEQMHAGLRHPDDVAAPGLAEAEQVARELADLPDVTTIQAPVALIFDYASAWAYETLPQGADFNYFRLVFSCYRSLRRAGLSIDIVSPDHIDFTGYRAVLAPGLATALPALFPPFRPPGHIQCLARALCVQRRISASHCPLARHCPVWILRLHDWKAATGSPSRGPGRWCCGALGRPCDRRRPASLHLSDGTPVLVGDGPFRYLAVWPDDTLWDRIVSDLCNTVGMPHHTLPDGLRLRQSGDTCFAFNYAPDPVTWQGHVLPAAGVAWWPAP